MGEHTAAFASIGTIAAVGAVFGITGFSLAIDSRNTISDLQTSITDLTARAYLLINDGALVSQNVSLFGTPPVTDQTTQQPKFHFKALVGGDNIAITDAVTYALITNTLFVNLAPATSSDPDAVSMVASSSSPNMPVVRNIRGGTGVTVTLDGDDVVISI